MDNKFSHTLRQRLESRLEWLNYYTFHLKHNEVSEKVKKEYYRDKPLLKLILNFYFLPTNLLKHLSRLKTRHDYSKCQKEVEILKQEIEENEKV
ncbi:MAG: hypothetical protein QGG95_04590 [Nitrospinota bacterium]|jgi:hypothetical protein|nr:hypothetical protein [Nitrospinota bacterium]